MMVTDTVLPVTMQPTVPGACDYPASMDVSDMVVRAMQFEQVAAMHGRAGAGQGVSHIQSMQKLCASLDLGVELSLRRKRTFGRQVLATGVVALSDLLHAQQEPIGVELRSAQGSPVAILHITVKGLEAMGTQEFMYLAGDVPNKAKVVPVTQASARRCASCWGMLFSVPHESCVPDPCSQREPGRRRRCTRCSCCRGGRRRCW